jgi:hypothetical protein
MNEDIYNNFYNIDYTFFELYNQNIELKKQIEIYNNLISILYQEINNLKKMQEVKKCN